MSGIEAGKRLADGVIRKYVEVRGRIREYYYCAGWRLASGGQTARDVADPSSVGAEPVEGWIFDDIARTFVLNDGVCRFFEGNNPYTLEDAGRRIFEVAPGC